MREERNSAGNSRAGSSLALYALERAARTDAAGVRAAWEKQRGHLPEADRLYGNARIAFHAARQQYPLAAEWFREAGNAASTDALRAWRVRAALRAGAWTDVLAAIEAMPPSEQEDSAWRYWKARALSATGRNVEANALFGGLASEISFYGMLSAEAIGQRQELASAPLEATAEALAGFGANPSVRRAVKLAALDMRPESQREWIYVVRGLPDDALLLAAEYARREGLYDRAINTAERTSTRHDFGLRYLMPFRAEFAAAAQDNAVELALLLGIARQESRFAADIVSSAGAVGLMQLMPPTAKWVAKQLNRPDYRPSQISDTSLNTQFGAYYFKYWLERLRPDAAPRGRRVQCRSGSRAGLARRDAARRSGLGRDDSVQRDPRLREEGAHQRHGLLALPRSSVRAAQDAARHRAATQWCRWQRRRVCRRGHRRSLVGGRFEDPGMTEGSILVLGGAGFVGRHVVEDLVASGYRVVVPTRRFDKARDLQVLPTVTVVSADAGRADVLSRLVASSSAVVNLVGILNETRHSTFESAHVDFARAVTAACHSAGVRRLIQMSALNADPAGPSRYLRSKGEAEAIVAASGLDWTIFRPSVIFGREDAFLNLFACLLRYVPVVALASPEARFQPVYVGDVARCIVEALRLPSTRGRIYPLCGPNVYTLRELVRYVGAVTGKSRPIIGLGTTLSTLQARVLEHLPWNSAHSGQSCIDAERQHVRGRIPCGVRSRAASARDGRALVPGTRGDHEPIQRLARARRALRVAPACPQPYSLRPVRTSGNMAVCRHPTLPTAIFPPSCPD